MVLDFQGGWVFWGGGGGWKVSKSHAYIFGLCMNAHMYNKEIRGKNKDKTHPVLSAPSTMMF